MGLRGTVTLFQGRWFVVETDQGTFIWCVNRDTRGGEELGRPHLLCGGEERLRERVLRDYSVARRIVSTAKHNRAPTVGETGDIHSGQCVSEVAG